MIRPLIDPPFLVIGTLLLLGVVVSGLVTAPAAQRRSWWRRGLMVVLLAAIALRPGFGTQPTPTRVAPLEVLLVIDRTTSMSALDWNGERPRLDGVRRDVADLMKALPSGRITLMTFGRDVRVELPSTQDETLIADTLSVIQQEAITAGRGSRIDRSLPTVAQLLTQMKQRQPDRPRLVVLMADGEDTSREQPRSFTSLKPLVDAGLVLGYGSAEGGLMPLDADGSEERWVEDPRTGEPALSYLGGDNLRAVAFQLGVEYVHREVPGGLEAVMSSWETAFREEVDEEGTEQPSRFDLTWLLAALLLAVTLWELRAQWRRTFHAMLELR